MRLTQFDHPIAALLRERGLNVHALAHELGITERTIYYWFNGQPLSHIHIARVAEFFGVSPDTIQ
jgi:plasmid maintenance system antidote protein VapI